MRASAVGLPARQDARGTRRPFIHMLRELLTALGVVVAFCCSAMLLIHVGYHYGSSGGSPLEKFHPASLLLCAAMVLLFVECGPVATAESLFKHNKLSLIYLACIIYYTIYIVVILNRASTFVVDTLILPCFVFLLLQRTDDARLRQLAAIIHLVMAINAAIGITEVMFQWRLIPLYLEDEAVTFDWRATALLGHPLSNATLTDLYALLLLTGLRGGLPRSLVWPAFSLQLLALPAFGGRTATVLLALGVCFWILRGALGTLLGQRFRLTTVLMLCFLVPLLGLGLSLAAETHYVTTFVDRFVNDEGSAETRVKMLSLFDHFSWGDLFIGPDQAMLSGLQIRVGVATGIESFVVAYILQSGIFAAGLVFIGLALFSIEIARALAWQAGVALVVFFALNAGSTGLSSKGTGFVLFVAMLVALARANAIEERVVPRPE